jgi:hypothetical protein
MVEKTLETLDENRIEEIPDEFFVDHEDNLGGDVLNSLYRYDVNTEDVNRLSDDEADVEVKFEDTIRVSRQHLENVKDMGYEVVSIDYDYGVIIRFEYNPE